MANRKLKSLKFPGIDDTYILDAGNVNYSDEETYEEGSVGEGLNALKEDIKDNYAKNDGYYDGMTVGNAEQIVGTVFEEDDTAYNYRTTGGSAEVGDRAYVDAITGGSLVWNQLAPEVSASHWTVNTAYGSASFADGAVTYTISAKNGNQSVIVPNANGGIPLIKGHKVLMLFDAVLSQSSSSVWVQTMDTQWALKSTAEANVKKTFSTVFESNQETGGNAYFGIYPCMGGGMEVGATAIISKVQIFDLTAMFGSTIADYIYSLETAHAGDGVAWFKRYFPKPYYAYHAVGMEHVNAVAAKTVGFNQWDEEWELGTINASTGQNDTSTTRFRCKNYIRVKPNTEYYFGATAGTSYNLFFYDADKNFLSVTGKNANATFTTPSDAAYMRFYKYNEDTMYDHDISIFIHWDNSRDGDYEPYNLHTYPLADLTLRGVPLIDESGNLYFDGDRYLPDGTVERRYGIVDLGTLTWVYENSEFSTTGAPSGIKLNMGYAPSGICGKYVVTSWQSAGDKILFFANNGRVYVHDTAYTDAATFKTAMSGVYLVYELATPTTEEADPYQYPMVVDNWGTEELIDGKVESGDRDVAIPVGHETKYPPNLKDKLESAANNPDADGAYILTHDGGSNTYTPLASNPTIQNIIARLEALEGGGE